MIILVIMLIIIVMEIIGVIMIGMVLNANNGNCKNCYISVNFGNNDIILVIMIYNGIYGKNVINGNESSSSLSSHFFADGDKRMKFFQRHM